jgi:hypothetical protein
VRTLKRFIVFTAVVACLVASIGIRYAVHILMDRVVHRAYPMVDRVDEAARIRTAQAREIREAEELLGWLALIVIPVGILFVRRELQRSRNDGA